MTYQTKHSSSYNTQTKHSNTSTYSSISTPLTVGYILLETGFKLLLETGFGLLQENSTVANSVDTYQTKH